MLPTANAYSSFAAKDIGAENFVTAVVNDPADWSRPELSEDQWAHLFSMLDEIEGITAAHGVRQVVHPHADTLIQTADEVERFLQSSSTAMCLDTGVRHAKQAGETDERLHAVAAWRESPHFDEAECAALALAEATTRIADEPEAVSDEIWDEAAKHYDEKKLGGLVLWIALTNLFNRVNVTTRQVAGSKQW